jgi:hypothetical protein
MLTFLQASFLFALIALAIPAILHLFNRQRTKRHIFPSIRFLQISQLPREGRRRLRDILLLFCRALLLSCLILALARPLWQKKAEESAKQDTKQIFLLLDASASMQNKGNIEQGKELLKDFLQSTQDWQIAAASFSNKVHEVKTFTDKKLDLQNLLDNWQATYNAGKPELALRAAINSFNQSATAKKIVFVSDFQASDWRDFEERLPDDISVEFLAVNAIQDNCSINLVKSSYFGVGKQRVLVKSKNHSSNEAKHLLSVKLGQDEQSRNITIPANSEQVHSFIFENLLDKHYPGEAWLSADNFPADDKYYFWATTGAAARVLLIVPEDCNPSQNAAFFCKKALETEQDGISGRFTVEVLGVSSLFAIDLNSFEIVFLLGASERMSTAELVSLKDFIEAGGGVIHCPGPAPNLSWRALQENALCTILYKGIEGEHSHRSALGLGWLAQNTVLHNVFKAEQSSDLFLFNIRKHARLEPDQNNEIILRSLSAYPILLKQELGKGSLYSFALSFDLSWSDLPLSQSFLPLIRELSSDLIQEDFMQNKIYCGDNLPDLVQLDGRNIFTEEIVDNSKPGLLTVDDFTLEINLNPAESDQKTIRTADLERLLYAKTNRADLPNVAANRDASAKDLWKIFALLTALFFLLEAIMTNFTDKKS